MSNLGYYKWMIEEVISRLDFTCDDNLLDKEYRKYFNKLSRKFEGNELDYQIRVKLINRGFTYDEVNLSSKLKLNQPLALAISIAHSFPSFAYC